MAGVLTCLRLYYAYAYALVRTSLKSPVSEKDTSYLAAKSESNVKSRSLTQNWPLSFVPVKVACIIKLAIANFLFSNCAQNYISFLKIMLPFFLILDFKRS